MIIVNIVGVALIALIVWWFWLYKPKVPSATLDDSVVIVENGVYQPSRIKVPADKPTRIQFLRKDGSPCASLVQFPDFNINEELPLEKTKSIALPAMAKGEYIFHCQMKMYKGVLIVE